MFTVLVFGAIEEDNHPHFILAGTFLVGERRSSDSVRDPRGILNKNILTACSYFQQIEIFDSYFFIHLKRRQLNNRKEAITNLFKTKLVETKPVHCWDSG